MVTLAEIASAAGVSKTAVSLALNYKSGVGAQKARRIREIASSLGYTLSKGRTEYSSAGMITCVRISRSSSALSLYHDAFLSCYIDGISQGLARSDYSLQIRVFEDTDIESIIGTLVKDPSSGYLLLGTQLEEKDMWRLSRYSVPMVVMDAFYPHVPLDFVAMNNTGSMYKVLQFLKVQGHEHIGYIDSSEAHANFTLRKRSFYQGLRSFGMRYIHKSDYLVARTTVEGACEDIMYALEQIKTALPSAYICANDTIAAGAMRAFGRAGLRIPEDVSLIGFDNLPGSEFLDPPLSSVTISCRQIGYTAARLLTYRIAGNDTAHQKVQIDGTFINRESVVSVRSIANDRVEKAGIFR